MHTTNKTRLLRVVKQLNKETADLCLRHVNHFIVFMYIFCNCYSIVFRHFGLCSRIKLRLRDVAFAKQLSFHVWLHEIDAPF